MSIKITVAICNEYKLELKLILSQEGFENFTAFYAPAKQNAPTTCDYSEKFMNNLMQQCQTSHIIGGSCLSITNKKYKKNHGADLHKVSHCHYFLASKAIVENLQSQGAYLVSPGWLNSWKKKINFWGFDQQTAQEFFSETTSKIVLLDSGVYENSGENLKTFAEFLNLPFEILYVGQLFSLKKS